MDLNKIKMIETACQTGDWTTCPDVTREELMEYILSHDETNCPLCGTPVKMYKITMTHRSYKYLLSAIFLCDKNTKEGGDGFVHHDEIREHAKGNFVYEKGKKQGDGINYTSYGNLTKYPWDFLESRMTTNYKPKRDGHFRITDRGRDFARGNLAVPAWIKVLDNKVVRYSDKLVYPTKIKDVNFKQCLDLFKTFS